MAFKVTVVGWRPPRVESEEPFEFLSARAVELELAIEALRDRADTADEITRLGDELDRESRTFPVWEENWPTWEAFLMVNTQWRTGVSGATGLDHDAVRGDLREAGVKNRRGVFHEILVIEKEILGTWGKIAEKRELERKRGRSL